MHTSTLRLSGRLGTLALIPMMAGCLDAEDPLKPVPIEETEFASSLGVDLDAMTVTSTGLYYLDEVVGEGEPAEYGNVMTVDYSFWLSDGRLVDTTLGENDVPLLIDGIEGDPPQTFGWNSLIAGWREGMVGMRVGGTRLLVIPYTLGYGPNGYAVVPPYANIVFRIHLLTNASASAE